MSDGAAKAVHLVAALPAQGMSHWISNLATVLTLDSDSGLPVTVNSARDGRTCYICCPSVAYLDYAIDELRHFRQHKAIKAALGFLLHIVRPLLGLSGLDQQVQVNNWLLATNPVPALKRADLVAITNRLTALWPGHSVVWRSLNDVSDSATLAEFRASGYLLLPARQIYLFDCRLSLPRISRDEKRDLALLAQSGYRQDAGPFDDADYRRMQELYRLLYLDKYTWLNPQYSAAYLKAMDGAGVLNLHGLRHDTGRLDGVIGFFDRGRVMTAPVVGYDTALPADLGLYRQLMALALTRARRQKLLFNMSAGAASFKRNRGGLVALEYTAVYNRHLGPVRRTAGRVIAFLLKHIGVPVLKGFEL